MKKNIALSAALGVFAAGGLVATLALPAADELPAKKVFVCKYVGKPGVDERLQTGNNPISVSVNSIEGEVKVGAYFADKQGRSYVLAWDTRTGGGQEGEPSVDDCPDPDAPTPEVTPTPKPTPTTKPTPKPTPTTKPTPKPTTKPTPKPTTKPTSKPTTKPTKPAPKPTTKPTTRGVPAKTGGEADVTTLGLLGLAGTAGVAASGAALVASRRKN